MEFKIPQFVTSCEQYVIRELEETRVELRITQEVNDDIMRENHRLENIVDTLKKHATFENGTVCIFLTESKKEDRDFIVKELKLKEEEKPNE